MLFFAGMGVDRNWVEARRWLEPAAEAGHAEAQRAGLAGRATAVHPGDDVVRVVLPELDERGQHGLLVDLVREVHVQRPPVDGHLSRPGDQPDAGDGLLAATGRLNERLRHQESTFRISRVSG